METASLIRTVRVLPSDAPWHESGSLPATALIGAPEPLASHGPIGMLTMLTMLTSAMPIQGLVTRHAAAPVVESPTASTPEQEIDILVIRTRE